MHFVFKIDTQGTHTHTCTGSLWVEAVTKLFPVTLVLQQFIGACKGHTEPTVLMVPRSLTKSNLAYLEIEQQNGRHSDPAMELKQKKHLLRVCQKPNQNLTVYIFGMGSGRRLCESKTAFSATTKNTKTKECMTKCAVFVMAFRS